MTHNDLEEYKKAVKSKYEQEKNGTYSNFLLMPSRANLRKLCAERFKGNKLSDDLTTYKILCGFEFEEGNINGLKKVTGRFRSIENFFKGITDTNDIEAIDLAAILVDFRPRPFRKFSKRNLEEEDIESEVQEKEIPQNDKKKKEPEKVPVILMFNEKVKANNNALMFFSKKKSIVLLAVAGLFFVGYTAKDLMFPKKQCMQWQKDHYEAIDCQGEVNSLYASAPIIPFDEDLVELNKLDVCDTTIFFEGKKAIVWYCKVDGEPEFFDGPGFHPITGNGLKPVTDYIINKYVVKK